MHVANRRRTRSSGSGLDQTNPEVDKVHVQGNASVPLQTPEAETLSGEEHKSTPVSGKKSSGYHRELVLGVPCHGQFEIHRSSKKLGGGGEKNVVISSHKRAKEVAGSSSVDVNATPVVGSNKRKKYIKKGLLILCSVEKLRPERELERARKEILRRKVKIRELFQHLDTLCAEGSLPESLFDSGGEISSEDIFCANCGSKDVHVDNDIILCDGFCDRGFHQYCVEPPLRKEDSNNFVPTLQLRLTDSLGTKLSVSDSWEKVFPEAAAAMAGGDQTLDCDLPSDDSEDEEYDPDSLNDNADDEDGSDESENEDGSCDGSDCTSASDEMIESFKEAKDIMDLPSDDSEDDDYDPDAPVPDEDKMQESSNSDNASDSEDLETSFKGNESNQQDEENPGR
ncbi:hypothetical protein Bca52824_086377 [Brassica carinata]|uniref:PHD-type domain-containing protein n=1 Tax=Brassica carinata TaxID=52824 RepID=A0A8X7TM68_BRACI|nr:hypothetical protein Bca52824_086377 [Brassica carinata]